MREGLAINKVRPVIADYLGVDVGRVVDEAHFIDDLGADWLDRLVEAYAAADCADCIANATQGDDVTRFVITQVSE